MTTSFHVCSIYFVLFRPLCRLSCMLTTYLKNCKRRALCISFLKNRSTSLWPAIYCTWQSLPLLVVLLSVKLLSNNGVFPFQYWWFLLNVRFQLILLLFVVNHLSMATSCLSCEVVRIPKFICGAFSSETSFRFYILCHFQRKEKFGIYVSGVYWLRVGLYLIDVDCCSLLPITFGI